MFLVEGGISFQLAESSLSSSNCSVKALFSLKNYYLIVVIYQKYISSNLFVNIY